MVRIDWALISERGERASKCVNKRVNETILYTVQPTSTVHEKVCASTAELPNQALPQMSHACNKRGERVLRL